MTQSPRNRSTNGRRLALAAAIAGALFTAWSGPASAAEPASGSDWPQWRGPRADGTSPEKDWSPASPKVLWRSTIGTGFSSVAVVGDRLYATGSLNIGGEPHETVWCLDTGSGKMVWQQDYAAKLVDNLHEGGPCSTPTVHDGRVFTLSKDGVLHCWGAEKGEPLWQADLKKELGLGVPSWGFASSGVIVGSNIVYQAGPTVAFDQKTGKLAWKSKPFKPAYGSPTLFELDGKPMLASLNQWGLVILSAADGSQRGSYRWQTMFDTNTNTPIVIDRTLFLSTGYDKGCALLQIQDGELGVIYRNKRMSNHINNSVYFGGNLYGFDGNSHRSEHVALVCLDARTGEERWRQTGLGCGSLIESDGKLLILSDRGELVIAPASAEGLKPISRTQILSGKCWTSPTLSHARLYARNATGELVCVDLWK